MPKLQRSSPNADELEEPECLTSDTRNKVWSSDCAELWKLHSCNLREVLVLSLPHTEERIVILKAVISP